MNDFFKTIKRGNQKFNCYKSGDEKEKLDLVVEIHHQINGPATGQDISILKKLISGPK